MLMGSGNVVGQFLFKVMDAPAYAPGFIACVTTSVATAILSMVYLFCYIWENKMGDNSGTLEDLNMRMI
jgi:hypothetical protein